MKRKERNDRAAPVKIEVGEEDEAEEEENKKKGKKKKTKEENVGRQKEGNVDE